MTTYRVWLAIVASACTTNSPNASAAPGATPPPTTRPAQPAVPPPAARPATSGGAIAEVGSAPEKTSTGDSVIAIGIPRFQLAAPDGIGPLVVRGRSGLVIAEDARAIAVWDAANGAPLTRIAPTPDATWGDLTSLAVSSDGEWLATGSALHVRLFRRPFDKVAGELACYLPRAYSHDAKLLACSTAGIGIWDVVQHRQIKPPPVGAPKDLVRVVRFAPDDRSLVWVTDRAVLRWDFAGAGAVAPIFQAPSRIEYAAIAESGSVAYVSMTGKKAVVVDLATGKAASAPADFGVAISPSGARLALEQSGSFQVTELATGKALWKTKIGSPVTRAAFGETDESLVYVEAGRLRVATVPGQPSAPTPTARFAGWLGNGTAAIERGDVLRSFTLATGAWAAVDRAALTPKPLAGAPAWATWIADAAGDRSFAAEPSKRHELAPDPRGGEPCNPKLRVWTPSGGTKTLAMACTRSPTEGHGDPGWEVGGGWVVGVSATTAAVFDPRTGKRVAALDVPRRKNSHPEFAPAYWQMALAPSGDWLALVWCRAELQGATGTQAQDPREDAMHIDEAATNVDCVSGDRGCRLEYFAELWSMKGAPKRVWHARLERSVTTHEPAIPTGVLAFDRADGRLLLGFDDGEIRIVSTAALDAPPRGERLHRAAITALSLDAVSGVFSADAAGEQRLWTMSK